MLIQKINTLIWFRWMNKTSSLIEDKRKDKVQRAYTQKVYPTGEFVIVAFGVRAFGLEP